MTEVLLRGHQVAQRLNVSKSLAYKLIAQGTIRSVKLGRSVRVRPEDLEAFIAQNVSGTGPRPLNAEPAAATASPDRDQVNHSLKEDTHAK